MERHSRMEVPARPCRTIHRRSLLVGSLVARAIGERKFIRQIWLVLLLVEMGLSKSTGAGLNLLNYKGRSSNGRLERWYRAECGSSRKSGGSRRKDRGR